LKLLILSSAAAILVVALVLVTFQNQLAVNGQQPSAVDRLAITILNGQAGQVVEISIKDNKNDIQDQQYITLAGPSTSLSYSVPPGLTVKSGYKACVNQKCQDILPPDTFGTSLVNLPIQ